MPSFGSGEGNVLYLVICAAQPARRAAADVAALRAEGWDVCVVLTPSAVAWVDEGALARASGHPVRSAFGGPDEPEFAPRGDAVLVAPATFNTVNKYAAGISDTLALGLMNEALGASAVPVALVPWVDRSLFAHPAFEPSLARLRGAGTFVVVPAPTEADAYDRAVRSAARGLWAALGH